MLEKFLTFVLSLLGLLPATLTQPIYPILQLQPTPTVVRQIVKLPESKSLSNEYHVFQTFNNCGPAALSMALSYFDVNISQQELGRQLRPYQVPGGDNDDKSVTLSELATKAEELGFVSYHRPMGSSELVKQFIAADIPVITRTWLKPNEDIGHYRVIKGYDDVTQTFIQDDSLQGKNLSYTYANFNILWEKFNYEYLVIVPTHKTETAQRILGDDLDAKVAWKKAADTSTGFNRSVALYNIGDYAGSVSEFEAVETSLPFRTLWYQLEPILAYYQLGNDERVLQISQKIIANQNRAYSELYDLRGKVYQRRGQPDLAAVEFTKARQYKSPRL